MNEDSDKTAPGFKLMARLRELEKIILPDCPTCHKPLTPLSRRSVPMAGGASQITLFECFPCERYYEQRTGLHITYDPNEIADKLLEISQIELKRKKRNQAASEAIAAIEMEK